MRTELMMSLQCTWCQWSIARWLRMIYTTSARSSNHTTRAKRTEHSLKPRMTQPLVANTASLMIRDSSLCRQIRIYRLDKFKVIAEESSSLLVSIGWEYLKLMTYDFILYNSFISRDTKVYPGYHIFQDFCSQLCQHNKTGRFELGSPCYPH